MKSRVMYSNSIDLSGRKMKRNNGLLNTEIAEGKLQPMNNNKRKIICILPISYSENSNGISTLCSIYKALQKSVPSQTIFVCKQSIDSKISRYQEIYGASLKIYSDYDKTILLRTLLKHQFILVRPDDLEGVQNEIHWELANSNSCHSIINILLAPPFSFSNKVSITKYYGKKDLFVLGNQSIMPAFADMEGKDMFIESDLDPELLDFRKNNDTVKRSKISVYIGKGIVRPLPDSIKNPLGIAKE